MDINILKTFVAVCEHSGFSAAAEKLGYTQSTVSSQIKMLEKELQTVLFDRYYHRISLTSDGIVVLGYARNILNAHEKMLTDINGCGQIDGDIRLAMSSSVANRYFGREYLGFRKQYPEIRLTITECGTEKMFDMLRKNEADLVFTLDSHIYESEFEICAERMERAHFVASAENRLAHIQHLNVYDIIEEPFILTEHGMSYRRLLDEKLASSSYEIKPVLEAGNPLQICEMVAESGLLSFLPDFITDGYVKDGRLVYLPVDDCDIQVWTQLLIHKNKWRSPALDAFVTYYKKIIEKSEYSVKN